jgi:CubicO group peptidase (beta-lactamase class C family)
MLPRCAGPSGLIHARAVDLLAFARLHLQDGVSATGQRLLSAAAATAMRSAEVAIPEPWTSGSHVGLGWMLFDWARPVFGHDGVTLGQNAYLRIVPGPEPVTVVLLVNGGDAAQLYQDLFSELLAEYAGVTMPPPLQPPAQPGTAGSADIVGTYERTLMTFAVEDRGGDLVLVTRPRGVLAVSLGTDRLEGPLVPFAPNVYLTRIPGRPEWLPVVFYQLGDGTPYLHVQAQAAPRAG